MELGYPAGNGGYLVRESRLRRRMSEWHVRRSEEVKNVDAEGESLFHRTTNLRFGGRMADREGVNLLINIALQSNYWAKGSFFDDLIE